MSRSRVRGNWVKETTSTSGTVETITLVAVSGFARVQDVPELTVGHEVRYSIEDDNGNRETGLGTRQAGSTFDRTTVESTLVGSVYDSTSPARISLSGSATLYLAANDIDWAIPASATTGLVSGGLISINADTTKFDIASGEGTIIDNYTDPDNVTSVEVSWSAFSAQTVDDLLVNPRTHLAINSSGAILQQSIEFSNSDAKDLILLGSLGHANLTNIVAVVNNPIAYLDVAGRFSDLLKALGALNITGNIFTPNGANLNINKSVGKTLRLGSNFHNNSKDVDTTSDISATVDSFIYAYRDGLGGWNLGTSTTAIVPGSYDDNSGTLASVSSNQWTIQVLKFWGHIDSPKSRIEYGQQTFANKQAALDSLPDVDAIDNPAFFDGVARLYMAVRGGATDLSDITHAVFIEAAKFGGVGAGQFSSATTDLQQAYDNSITPEIITDGTRGALTIKEGASVAGNLIETKDDADATMFSSDFAGDTATVGTLSFGKAVYKIGATLNGTAIDNHVNLGAGTSVTGVTSQTYDYCTVGGGLNCQAIHNYATVSGGSSCSATGQWSSVSGGIGNGATGTAANVGGGNGNSAASTYAAVPGGRGCKANHTHSVAMCGGSLTRANFDVVIGATNTGASSTANNTIRLQGTGGNIKIDGAVTSPEADYAEFFEWANGNPSDKDHVGQFVSLVAGKIVLDGSNIIGIISGTPAIIGNGAPNHWHKMYLRDKHKRQIKVSYDLIEWVDEWGDEQYIYDDLAGNLYNEYPQPTSVNGILSTKTPIGNVKRTKIKTPKINPDFDISQEYIPREDRKEWDIVGLLGQLVVNTSEPITGTHIDVLSNGDVVNGSTYQVIEVLDSTTVTVFYK